MMTTYRINSDELSIELIDLIKEKFSNKDLIIDVYEDEKVSPEYSEITNPEVIKRIKEIENGEKLKEFDINKKKIKIEELA